jgi:hypothetical protein
VQVKATLAVAGSNTTVTVEGAAEALEVDPSAHVDADRVQLAKIPALDPGAGLSQAIVYSTGGVAADGNGFFHPLGDHAQVGFIIDGQPISDQQSATYDVVLRDGDVVYPTPWARDASTSFLLSEADTREALEQAGFNAVLWRDDTQIGLEWFKRAMDGPQPGGPNLGVVMGPDFRAMTGNLASNLRENRLGVLSTVVIRN